ncbi:hypothetical protein ACMFMG_003264 [Clarireedia jacksonii]
MAILDSIKRQFQPSPKIETAEGISVVTNGKEKEGIDVEKPVSDGPVAVESGVVRVEVMQAVWGRNGRWILIAGELDNSTVYIYQTYATSSFNQLQYLSTLATAGSLIFAVIKPPIAKLSNIIGRGETYILTISCYLLSYVLCASAKSIHAYAAGYIFYCVGQSGTNIMNDIIISDITNARWRALGIGISFFPFLITPWIAAFITDSVVNGIGWRWGIGIFAILMPFCASFIITTLLYFQHKAKKSGLIPQPLTRITIYDFCSQIDLGGTLLFVSGFAMLLLPLSLAATTPARWRTPYLDVLIALGGSLLLALPFYEKYQARHPIIPPHYFMNLSIVTSLLLIATDSLGFACTHTYLYSWSIITHNLRVRTATFYIYTNGVTQCLCGIIAGLIMLRTRCYKTLLYTACFIRLLGYGLMIRLRGANNPLYELFLQQAIQGIGSGIIQTAVFVSAQIAVGRKELAQITALVVCASVLGSSVGATVSGGIYTGTFRGELRKALGSGSESLVEGLFESITGIVPGWGSVERVAVNQAVGFGLPLFAFAPTPPPKLLRGNTTNERNSTRM